jgi:hypothetical protein
LYLAACAATAQTVGGAGSGGSGGASALPQYTTAGLPATCVANATAWNLTTNSVWYCQANGTSWTPEAASALQAAGSVIPAPQAGNVSVAGGVAAGADIRTTGNVTAGGIVSSGQVQARWAIFGQRGVQVGLDVTTPQTATFHTLGGGMRSQALTDPLPPMALTLAPLFWTTTGGTLTSVAVATGTGTVTTSTAHGFSVGHPINLANATTVGISGTYNIATTPTTTTFTITGMTAANGTYNTASDPNLVLRPAQSVTYYVCALDYYGNRTLCAASNVLSFSAPLSMLASTFGASFNGVQWAPVLGATGYEVLRSTAGTLASAVLLVIVGNPTISIYDQGQYASYAVRRDASVPFNSTGLSRFDGPIMIANAKIIGPLNMQPLLAPVAPNGVFQNFGGTGTTTYTYAVACVSGTGSVVQKTPLSPTWSSATNLPASLDDNNAITLFWDNYPGCDSYDAVRTLPSAQWINVTAQPGVARQFIVDAGNATGRPQWTIGAYTAATRDASGDVIANGQITNLAWTTGGAVVNAATGITSTLPGTTTTVLHGNAAGLPTFGAVGLTTDVAGILPIANGGTGSSSVTVSERDFSTYNAANVGAATALSETTSTNASTATAASKITTDIAGVGAGNFVVQLCTDGVTCAAGNQRLTCTQACTAAAGIRTACTVNNGGTIAAGTVLTWAVTTACTNDPGVNVNAHITTP